MYEEKNRSEVRRTLRHESRLLQHMLETLVELETCQIQDRIGINRAANTLAYAQAVYQQDLCSLHDWMNLVSATSNKGCPLDIVFLLNISIGIAPVKVRSMIMKGDLELAAFTKSVRFSCLHVEVLAFMCMRKTDHKPAKLGSAWRI